MVVVLEPELIAVRSPDRRMVGSRPLRLLGDEQLARLIASGNRQAFAVVYERHLSALVRYCRGILLVAEDAEDAAQSAMVSALRTLPDRPPRLELRAWLFRVAHNEAISMLRRRRAHEPLDDEMPLASPDAADTAEAAARLRELVKDLQSLPERQRGALVMRELCDLSYQEIAAALGCNQSTAMQTVHEARGALTQYAEGRNLDCAGVQGVLSEGDRRALRGRRVQAHMRACDGCRTYEQAVARRRRDFRLLVPVAWKGGLLAWLAGLRAGTAQRLAGVAVRIPPAPGGVRSAVVATALLAGGGAVELAHRAPAARHHVAASRAADARVHAARQASATSERRPAETAGRPAAAARHHVAVRPVATHTAASSPGSWRMAVRRAAAPVARSVPTPAPPAVAAPSAVTRPVAPPQARSVSVSAPGSSVNVTAGPAGTAGAKATATVAVGGTTASASGTVSVGRRGPAAAVAVKVDSAPVNLNVGLCLLNCR